MQAKYAEAQKAYYNGQYLEMESEVILGYSKPKGTYLLYFGIFFLLGSLSCRAHYFLLNFQKAKKFRQREATKAKNGQELTF